MKHHLLDPSTRRFGRILHYTGLLATVISVTGGYSLFHSPVVENIAETAEKIEQLKLSVQNAVAIRDQHQKVSQTLALVKERIASVQQRVPQNDDAGEFLKEVSQIAAEEKLAVKDFHPNETLVKNGYAQLEVTLVGRGSYASICAFFDRLSKLTRLSKLQHLTLTVSGNATEYPMTATIVIYYGLRGEDVKPAAEVKRG
jgi:Tfp pilus assembly protein PilO